jgi:SAM-dependent methyltransferase
VPILSAREWLRAAATPTRYPAALRRRWRIARLRGRAVECPCCGGRFSAFMPVRGRADAVCPRCGAQERPRALWLFIERRTDLLARPQRLLHFAPELIFRRRFEQVQGLDYVSADLDSPEAMEHFDITEIPHPDASFDAIVCSHVLEHVEDDRAAMRELVRVLKPGGFCVLLVPRDLSRARTHEDPAISTPAEREREFWQHDHVRLYGRDFAERLAEEGFEVTVDGFVRELPAAERERHRLLDVEDIFVGRRPAAG